MKQSKLFAKTLKEAPKEAKIASHKLLLRAGFISQLASGIYSFPPLGYRVLKNIENIIREEMEAVGGQEVFLPTLQPKELWQKTKRWENMDPPLFRVKDRHKKEFALGPTHEEAITDLAKSGIFSYKDLPFYLFQIQNKFRNELRFSGGLLRTREFIMKDLYSFHTGQKDLDEFFNKILLTYNKIFQRCGLKAIKSRASGGVFTKEKTYEFQVLSEVGEDRIFFCQKCGWAINAELGADKKICPDCQGKLDKKKSIELGHTFQLGTKYSRALGLNFQDKKGQNQFVIMGCYGIGLGRLMAAIVEINRDQKGIIWPKEVAPFQVHLIPIEKSQKVKKAAENIYRDLQNKKIEVLYDDRADKSIGEKFAESDLIGIPLRIVVSEKTLKQDCLEIKKRNKKKVELIKINSLKIAK
jgi:prolyl-tRNA synthetase